MNIIHDWPPNIDEIRKVLNPSIKTIFCYAPDIYVPSGDDVAPHILAHEQIHIVQQAGDRDGWWDKYLKSQAFRLKEEIPAHIAEYKAFCDAGFGRNARRQQLAFIAKRLSGPLYGKLISFKDAKTILKKGAELDFE